MATNQIIPDSQDSDVDILGTPVHERSGRDTSAPLSALSHRFRESSQNRERSKGRDSADGPIAVMVSGPARPWEYQPFNGDTTVDSVLEKVIGSDGEESYRIDYETGKKEIVSLENLLQLRNGQNALDLYNDAMSDGSEEYLSGGEARRRSRAKRTRNKVVKSGFVDSYTAQIDSEEDISDTQSLNKRRRLAKDRASATVGTRQSSRVNSGLGSRAASRMGVDDGDSSSDVTAPVKRGAQQSRGTTVGTRTSGRTTRSGTGKPGIKLDIKQTQFDEDDSDELAGDGDSGSENSGIVYTQKKTQRRLTKDRPTRSQATAKKGKPRQNVSSSEEERPAPSRRSGRDRGTTKNMRERDMDEEIYADEVVKNNVPKVISIREIFQPISKDSDFRVLHNNFCDVCSQPGTHSNKGPSPLIYCQGCSTSIHKVCLGYRSGREHMVTKVGHENFVMQCRRCIGVATRKDDSAPRLDSCYVCKKQGLSCKPFSPRKTAKQEEKLREENEGDDPVTPVAAERINNARNVLFRCTGCQRCYHFEHLPPLFEDSKTSDNVETLRDLRFEEYKESFNCKDCLEMDEEEGKAQALVAWRPVDRDAYTAGDTAESLREDEKEYLIKWEGKSYFKCTWMPGSWVWGTTSVLMRKAFYRRDEGANLEPKYTNEEAIPEEFLRMEIIFEVEYEPGFRPKNEKADKARIEHVDRVHVKFLGLTYEDSVWEEPPNPEDEDRWSDYVAAYNEFVAGKYFNQIPAATLKERIDAFRTLNFEKKVELERQPSALTGGEMMPYQMEGLNWLLYNFHQKKNVILADEMGLGKTIQIISMIASLVKDSPKCWPFLVVTPNSTCPNWRREIKKWAPGLRVVAYYGVKKARDMAMKYELYPDGCSDMRAHVVVTSYEAPVDDHSKSFFRRIKWAGMIVDEGQRLKNDENLLYGALQALKTPFQVLLTGTPLQNNKRELFNLLQFLDTSINAAELDEKYEELTKENLPELHDLIRPFFLRRTKLQVLKFLPPMAQVILPVTMSSVQKKLYKSILAKNPELIKSIFGQTKAILRPTERGNLNNILMQLRKCLCHPFLYSSAIEERSANETALHRNLIDASSKFQLLEIMLPKLKERGHRVLLFSQFLNQLDLVEDFLTGLDLSYQRLDGTITTLEKQKRIDAFNAPDSSLFAFLLSTRAGGVGINLATADTVIIMDPDFNPHQDIQALSRAHRIGQKKKVLVFQLMTKDTAEEKIVQIGRKKMALDQALIESMGTEDDVGVDLESILKHGAEALFNDDDENDIHYDSASVDKLLDRTQVENTETDTEKTAESQFSFARVWANDKGTLTDDLGDADAEPAAPNLSVWDKILKEREAEAAIEAAKNMQKFGRGQRSRQMVDYKKSNQEFDDEMVGSSPHKKPHHKQGSGSGDDMDFASVGESEPEEDSDAVGEVNLRELDNSNNQDRPRGMLGPSAAPSKELGPPPQTYSQFEHAVKAVQNRLHQPLFASPPSQNPNAPQVPYPNPGPPRGIEPRPILPPGYGTFREPASGNPPPGFAQSFVQPNYTPAPYSYQPVPSNYPPVPYNHPPVPSSYPPNGKQAPQQEAQGPARDPLQRPSFIMGRQPDQLVHKIPIPVPAGFTAMCNNCNNVHGMGICPPPKKIIVPSICDHCNFDHSQFSHMCPTLLSTVQIRLQLDRLKSGEADASRTYLRTILAYRAQNKNRGPVPPLR